MNEINISVNVVVLNGEKYVRRCLESIRAQSYPHAQIEVSILDNGSTDKTLSIIEDELPHFKDFANITFTKNPHNLGMWGGQEALFDKTSGKYVLILSIDVIMEKDFLSHSLKAFSTDAKIGAVQGKIYQFDNSAGFAEELPREIIDTCGFQIERSRRVLNIGHGQKDQGQFEEVKEVFGVEGAVPIFRREALESIRVLGEIADHDLFWYGEDLDVAWRLRLAGWKQLYVSDAIAWHDRGTTKSHSHGSWLNYIGRVGIRRQVAIKKRRLEWRNTRWTRIKNDYIINILRDLPYILWREIEVLGYTILFEPGVLKEVPKFFNGIPLMLKKRQTIMRRAKASPAEVHQFFS